MHKFGKNKEIRRLVVNVLGGDISIEPVKSSFARGIGTTEPIEIATVGEKKLYMHLWWAPLKDLILGLKDSFNSDLKKKRIIPTRKKFYGFRLREIERCKKRLRITI